MIKKVIIKMLFVIMVVAFSAIVMVQWLWIKYVIRERENQFTSQVYDVLNRVVNRIDEINYLEYQQEVNKHIGSLQNYNNMIIKSMYRDDTVSNYQKSYSNLLNSFNSEVWQSYGNRSYLNASVIPKSPSGAGKIADQEFIMQAIRAMELPQRDSVVKDNYYVQVAQRIQKIIIRLVKERDPENMSLEQRLQNIDIYSLLESYFGTYHIRLPFSYEIMTKEKVLTKVREGEINNFYYVEMFQQDWMKKGYYLGVKFESIQPVLLENMGWLLLASGFCVVGLLFVFFITLLVMMRQQKLSIIKNDFINNMTHEFKTPIATISLATAALTKEKVLNDKEQILKFCTMIKSENSRMNKYVERILQQAKLDRRELQMNKIEVDVNELVREAVEHFALLVQNAGGVLECKYEAENFIYKADEVHLMNVVCNLIDNAIKYSSSAPEIFVYTREEPNAYVIGVQDHGIGISKDDQKKVFKRFYRVTSGNLHNVKGFGLGLSYVKSVVELHDGVVHLTSKKNKGTLVLIKLKKNENIKI